MNHCGEVMMKTIFTGLMLPLLSFAANKPPRAEKIPHEMKTLGDQRTDFYYWLRDIKNPKVKKHLEAENKYYDSYFTKADLKLKSQLVEEVKTKIEEDESSPEIAFADFTYYSKAEKGKNYRKHFRRNLKSGKEEILLDENKRAEGKEFFAVRSKHLSPDLKKIAWCLDFDGSGKCAIEIQDLQTMNFQKAEISGVYWGQMHWAPDSKSLFYTMPNEAWRPDSIWMMNEKGEKKKVLSEADELFNLDSTLTTDETMVLAESASFETSKSYYWDGSEFKELVPSKNKVLASIDHSDLGYVVRSNHKHKNYGIYSFQKPGTPPDQWQEVIAPQSNAKLTEVGLLPNTVVYSLLSKGNEEVHVFNASAKNDLKLQFADQTYSSSFHVDGAPHAIYVNYSSPLSPPKTYQVQLPSGELKQIHEKKSPSLKPELYQTELLMVPARDGKQIPIHVVYRKDKRKATPQPALLYSYGSYGYTIPSAFNETLFSLLDRGFIYINAHIRGSDAQGEDWYDDGKLMNKKNTFNDMVDVSDFLIQNKWTSGDLLAIRGGSAGGLLMGAAINQKPQNFRAVIAEVPFVDVLTTMLDPTIPLTTQEYLQWGNPNEEAAYKYMKSYSPYDNIQRTKYPAIYVQTGVNDQQVAYWEPAKWVQKLREYNESTHPVIMKCNMGAGHGGASGRYKRYEEMAEKYVFLLKELKVQ
jgi:oligopeptidase B